MARLSEADISRTTRPGKVPVRPTSRRLRLYAHEYPILIDALTRLIDEVPSRLPDITLLALFGSVARLEPRKDSDTDILALFDLRDEPNTREREDELAVGLFHAITATVYADERAWPRWGLTTVTGDAIGSGLDADLLSIIGREGVLLYQRPDASLPPLLEHLTPFSEWREHVQAAIDTHV